MRSYHARALEGVAKSQSPGKALVFISGDRLERRFSMNSPAPTLWRGLYPSCRLLPSIELSDAKVYELSMQTLLGTALVVDLVCQV